jgi:di/tricarboxylate transporter
MNDMTLTYIILGITMVLFMWGRWQPDLIAVGSLLALYLFGVVTLPEAFSGFANSTVILIAALFVVGEGLGRTGVTAYVGDKLIGSARGDKMRLLVFAMVATALMSGVISNAGTVATLMPAVVVASWGVKSTPARFLIPVAFAANAGGLLTLTGTPPNIVVSEALAAAGFREFGFFEFALIGVPLLVIAVIYMAVYGRRLLPEIKGGQAPPVLDREMQELADAYSLNGELYRMRIRTASPLRGSSLRDSNITGRFGVVVVQIVSRADITAAQALDALVGHEDAVPDEDQELHRNDVLMVSGTRHQIQELEIAMVLGILPVETGGQTLADLLTQEIGIAEVLLTPRSSYIGKVPDGSIGNAYGVLVLGIRRGDRQLPLTATLQFGDALLVRGTWASIGRMAKERRNFVVVGQPDELASQVAELSTKSWLAIAYLIAMVVLMVTGIVPVVIAALLAGGAMLMSGCLTKTQAYRAVSWSTVILIGGMIPMAIALEKTGAAQQISDALVNTLGEIGPVALLAGVFVVTTAFSQVISNTASAVLMTPIVLTAAAGLGVSPHPLMMGLAVGASSAFLTPIGTAPNLMVMAPGGYSFKHYTRVGAPLLVLFLITSLLLIPVFWPF